MINFARFKLSSVTYLETYLIGMRAGVRAAAPSHASAIEIMQFLGKMFMIQATTIERPEVFCSLEVS